MLASPSDQLRADSSEISSFSFLGKMAVFNQTIPLCTHFQISTIRTPPANAQAYCHNYYAIVTKIIQIFDGECCRVLQCGAVCCSVLQCAAVCCSLLQCATVCCSLLQCAAVCCSLLQFADVFGVQSQSLESLCLKLRTSKSYVLQCDAACCSV